MERKTKNHTNNEARDLMKMYSVVVGAMRNNFFIK